MSHDYMKIGSVADDGPDEADLLRMRNKLQSHGMSTLGANEFTRGFPISNANDRWALVYYVYIHTEA